MSVKGFKFSTILIIFGILSLAFGVYDLFFHSAGFEKTTATVVSVEETMDVDEEATYTITVQYDVDGKTYSGVLDTSSDGYEVGDTVDVLYDPDDPSIVHSAGKGIGLYALILGILLLASQLFTKRKETKSMAELKKSHPEGTVYAPSSKGEESHLYFLTDTLTAKVGHHIEDENRNVLYEAKVTEFTLSAPTGFDFIDHEHGTTRHHLVGHQEDTEWSTLLIDDHSTFTFDGEYIWDHLKKNGISVESSFMEDKFGWPQYRIFRNGDEIALVQSSSYYVHEEDAEEKGKLGDLVPNPGFYRIWTAEENLDLLFVTIMAFARTSAHDDTGGNYGLFLHRKDGTQKVAAAAKEQIYKVERAPEDIDLFYQSVQGYNKKGEKVHLGTEGFYHVADQTVYVEEWGPDRKSVKKYLIPEDVEKTKEAILQYLKEKENIIIPM